MSGEMIFRMLLIIGCIICTCSGDDKVTKAMGVLAIILLSVSILWGCFVR